jgi:hypothetical protein
MILHLDDQAYQVLWVPRALWLELSVDLNYMPTKKLLSYTLRLNPEKDTIYSFFTEYENLIKEMEKHKPEEVFAMVLDFSYVDGTITVEQIELIQNKISKEKVYIFTAYPEAAMSTLKSVVEFDHIISKNNRDALLKAVKKSIMNGVQS